MKAALVPVIMLVAGAGAGAGAGLFMGGSGDGGGSDHGAAVEPAAPDAHGSIPTPTPTVGEPEAHSGGHGGEAVKSPTGTEFARLSNQFIVPVVKGDKVVSLVVLSLTLEVEPGGTETVFATEPRLRDSFLRVLFDHANVGGFDASFTQSGTMTLLRRSLLEAATATLGQTVRDILIVDIVRQEV